MESYIDLLLKENPELEYLRKPISDTVAAIVAAYRKGGKIMICGNGGSCSDSDHIVAEFMKGFLLKRELTEAQRAEIESMGFDNGKYIADSLQQGIEAVSLTAQTAIGTAVINDIGSDMMYAQQVYAMGREGDLFIGISTGGNAENVINALKVAKSKKITACGLTGKKCGKMNGFCDILIDVPSVETYRIQEYHIKVYHAFCAEAERIIFGKQ